MSCPRRARSASRSARIDERAMIASAAFIGRAGVEA
jgi:hypothetical protein